MGRCVERGIVHIRGVGGEGKDNVEGERGGGRGEGTGRREVEGRDG